MILKNIKKHSRTFFAGFVLFFTFLTPGTAQESIAEMVLNSCKPELVNYCSKATPGRGRIVACLYAHSNKLSNQCSLSIEIGVVQLNMILSAVSHVIDQCEADLDKHCGDVEIGGGKMYQCMSKNKDNLKPQCKAAFLRAEEDLK